MYSYEDRMRAVKLYIQYDYSFASVRNELGYPKHHDSLHQWYVEFQENSDLKHRSTRTPKFTEEQRRQAIEHYYSHGRCVSRTVRLLGYPSRTLFLSCNRLFRWSSCIMDDWSIAISRTRKYNVG